MNSDLATSAAHYEEFKKLVAQMRQEQRRWQCEDPIRGILWDWPKSMNDMKNK